MLSDHSNVLPVNTVFYFIFFCIFFLTFRFIGALYFPCPHSFKKKKEKINTVLSLLLWLQSWFTCGDIWGQMSVASLKMGLKSTSWGPRKLHHDFRSWPHAVCGLYRAGHPVTSIVSAHLYFSVSQAGKLPGVTASMACLCSKLVLSTPRLLSSGRNHSCGLSCQQSRMPSWCWVPLSSSNSAEGFEGLGFCLINDSFSSSCPDSLCWLMLSSCNLHCARHWLWLHCGNVTVWKLPLSAEAQATCGIGDP